MKSSDLEKFVRQLHGVIIDTPRKKPPNELNEAWTKQSLIVPLLVSLGWDLTLEIQPESHPDDDDVEGSIDFLLQPQTAEDRRLCIEAKRLLITPPDDDRKRKQIEKGLEQSKQKRASHFVWTNGDTWQFFALAMPDAPIYGVTISATQGSDERIATVTKQLQVLDRAVFLENPRAIDDAIKAHWKAIALPAAFHMLLNESRQELLDLMKRALPENLEVDDDEVFKFLQTCQPTPSDVEHPPTSRGKTEMFSPSPDEWENLISNDRDPKYKKARKQLLQNQRTRLAQYIVGEKYEPWRAIITYSILGLGTRSSETKTITGPAVGIYRKWGFIRLQDSSESKPGRMIYERVEEAVPYLKRLLELR